MFAPTDKLVRARALPGVLELRADDAPDDGRLATVDIRFARFSEWNEIDSVYEGRFLERLAPGAFTKTMRERAGKIVSLFNHGHDPQIGDKVLGPIEDMGERADGPYVSVALMDTSYGRDLLPGLKAGLYGASYMFRVINEDWVDEVERSEHNPHRLPERTIREVKLYEAGPVTFPADENTAVGTRSLTDRYLDLRTLDAARAARGGHPVDAEEGREQRPAEPPDEALARDHDEHDQTLALLRTL
jgi:HK97 family phage prohead protease